MSGAGLIQSPWLFAMYLRLLHPGWQATPGSHLLNDALSPREIAQRLGRLSRRAQVKLSIPEGLHHQQIAERLSAAQICSADSFKRSVVDRRLLAELGIRGGSLEGYLFPATYDFLVDSSAEAVARTLVRETRRRLEKLAAQQPGAALRLQSAHGWGEHEILTLASIVEREAATASEQKTIASVFYNRLRDPEFRPKGTLQSDPTAVYGCLIEASSAPSCSGFSGKVTPAMLRDPLNRYNTYKHAGLPPGPIANPGEGAIRAVLEPAQTDYLFFFASGERRHTFSRSFDEHRAVVRASGGGMKAAAAATVDNSP